MPGTLAPVDDGTRPDPRIDRLSTASVRKVLEPEELFDWSTLGDGQVVGDPLLSISGLGVELTAEEKARLSREEVAARLRMGIRFEAVLNAGFSLQIAEKDPRDPRVTYMLHEIGEETRHQRAFIRLIEQLQPAAENPFDRAIPRLVVRFGIRRFVKMPTFLMVLVLAGEELPDLLQKLASEHPDTDPLLAAVNRYHRQEEARHLSFARMTMGELWQRAGWLERLRVRYLAPLIIGNLTATFVHPGVYRTVGLPGWRTWWKANRTGPRVAVRHAACRNILRALLDVGVLRRGRIPRGWRTLCGVDRHGEPIPGDVPLPTGAAA
jgi:hypothetical protein